MNRYCLDTLTLIQPRSRVSHDTTATLEHLGDLLLAGNDKKLNKLYIPSNRLSTFFTPNKMCKNAESQRYLRGVQEAAECSLALTIALSTAIRSKISKRAAIAAGCERCYHGLSEIVKQYLPTKFQRQPHRCKS